METLRTVWSDIKRTIKQNKADFEIPNMQGWYWTLVTGDRLRALHIQNRRSGSFRTSLVLPVQTAAPFPNRPYVTLPASIYDLDMDRGVDSMAYYVQLGTDPGFARVEGYRVDPSEVRMFEMSSTKRPTPENFIWWREGDKLYMMGVIPSTPNMELKVYSNLPDILTVDPDAVFEFPKELLHILKRAVIDEGRYALALPGQYLRNDGTNRPAAATVGAPEKTQSVNDPLNNLGEETAQ